MKRNRWTTIIYVGKPEHGTAFFEKDQPEKEIFSISDFATIVYRLYIYVFQIVS